MIDQGFPKPRPRVGDNHTIGSTEQVQPDSACPARSMDPPPLPKDIPGGIDLTEDKVEEKLKSWILTNYGSSVFNNCEHHKLPQMSGTPLEFHINTSAKPVACHKVVPVPLHWKARVKADLDRDVALGFLEKVLGW